VASLGEVRPVADVAAFCADCLKAVSIPVAVGIF
jgi:hypothetical protein